MGNWPKSDYAICERALRAVLICRARQLWPLRMLKLLAVLNVNTSSFILPRLCNIPFVMYTTLINDRDTMLLCTINMRE